MDYRNPLRLLAPPLLVGLITLAKLARPEIFVGHAPFLAFFASILASAAIGGMLGGLLATLLSMFSGWFFFFGPERSFEIAGSADAVRIIIFVLEGVAISLGAAFLDRRGRQLARSRAALEEGMKTLETLVGVTPAAIVATEPDGRIFLFNDACEKLTGYAREEVLGRSLIETMVPGSWRKTVIERFGDIRSPALQEPHDNPWITKSGEERLIEWRCLPISRPAGPGVLGAGIDVTERRRAEQQKAEALEKEEDRRRRAERENLEKDLFVASVSHELRTPLTSIIGWSELIELAARDPEITEKGIRAIRGAAQTQLRLVNDLLDLSRVREGKLELRRATIDFVPIVEEVATTLTPSAVQKNLELQVSRRVPSALVLGDADRLRQVLLNLVENSIKYTVSGRIDVAVEADAGHVAVHVSDTGRGIGSEFLPQVFEPFAQEKRDGSGASQGLGIGLAVVKQIIELHGGEISAHSDGVDRGSRFLVKLPIAG